MRVTVDVLVIVGVFVIVGVEVFVRVPVRVKVCVLVRVRVLLGVIDFVQVGAYFGVEDGVAVFLQPGHGIRNF